MAEITSPPDNTRSSAIRDGVSALQRIAAGMVCNKGIPPVQATDTAA